MDTKGKVGVEYKDFGKYKRLPSHPRTQTPGRARERYNIIADGLPPARTTPPPGPVVIGYLTEEPFETLTFVVVWGVASKIPF